MQSKRLHIGSGKVYLPGWTNIDLFSNAKADIYCDMMRLPFEKETFDEVYSCHVLEHTHRRTVYAVLHHWRELLKTGGILRLAVPDFAKCVEWYNKTGDLPSLLGLLYGGQDSPLNSHCIIFDETTLKAALIKVGFKDVGRWDWRQTDHAEYDDFASAYLPHLKKDDGILMSLNLLATK